MCGIVGLFLKAPDLEPKLGALAAKMLGTMCSPTSSAMPAVRRQSPSTTPTL
jgi:hypothetical protein